MFAPFAVPGAILYGLGVGHLIFGPTGLRLPTNAYEWAMYSLVAFALPTLLALGWCLERRPELRTGKLMSLALVPALALLPIATYVVAAFITPFMLLAV